MSPPIELVIAWSQKTYIRLDPNIWMLDSGYQHETTVRAVADKFKLEIQRMTLQGPASLNTELSKVPVAVGVSSLGGGTVVGSSEVSLLLIKLRLWECAVFWRSCRREIQRTNRETVKLCKPIPFLRNHTETCRNKRLLLKEGRTTNQKHGESKLFYWSSRQKRNPMLHFDNQILELLMSFHNLGNNMQLRVFGETHASSNISFSQLLNSLRQCFWWKASGLSKPW